jgi:6-phosphogluconate dehydrogenase (decarboxylating)
MSDNGTRPVVGFIVLGDQGLPVASAIAEAGFSLHAWARRPTALDALGYTPQFRHDEIAELGSVCDVVGLCVSTDEDVLGLVGEGLLPRLRRGSIVVNHGTGTPGNGVKLTEICAPRGVDLLDAPVSGGRPAPEARTLTTIVGGLEPVATQCEPIFARGHQNGEIKRERPSPPLWESQRSRSAAARPTTRRTSRQRGRWLQSRNASKRGYSRTVSAGRGDAIAPGRWSPVGGALGGQSGDGRVSA